MKSSYHHGDLRRALLRAARDEVARRGAHGFSLRAVASSVGVDPAAVYRHFDDKAALLGALAAEGFVQLADEMIAAMRSEVDAHGRLRAIGRSYVRFAVADTPLFRLMFGPRDVAPLPEICLPPRTPHALLVDALHALHAERPLRMPAEQAMLPCWAAVHGLAALWVDRRVMSLDDVDAAVDQVLDVVLAGVVRPPP